jgi:putative endonuclease
MPGNLKKPRNNQFGAWGEQEAERFLVGKGLEIIAKNFRIREGEIDLIARDGEETVFIEVKTRKNSNFGYPEEAVTEEKLEHLISAAESYLTVHPEIKSWRIDVLALISSPGKEPTDIEWYKNVE